MEFSTKEITKRRENSRPAKYLKPKRRHRNDYQIFTQINCKRIFDTSNITRITNIIAKYCYTLHMKSSIYNIHILLKKIISL